jgi:hypothetical protein
VSAEKHHTVSRLVEGLASTLAPPPVAAELQERRLELLAALHVLSKRERRAGQVPFVHARCVPSRLEYGDARVKGLMLEALSAMVACQQQQHQQQPGPSAPISASASGQAWPASLVRRLGKLSALAADFAPGSLFGDWSPAQLAPERPLGAEDGVHPRRAVANHTTAPLAASSAAAATAQQASDRVSPAAPLAAGIAMAQLQALRFGPNGAPLQPAPGAALPAWDFACWRTDKVVASSSTTCGFPVWGVALARPTAVSSIKLYWGVRELHNCVTMPSRCLMLTLARFAGRRAQIIFGRSYDRPSAGPALSRAFSRGLLGPCVTGSGRRNHCICRTRLYDRRRRGRG